VIRDSPPRRRRTQCRWFPAPGNGGRRSVARRASATRTAMCMCSACGVVCRASCPGEWSNTGYGPHALHTGPPGPLIGVGKLLRPPWGSPPLPPSLPRFGESVVNITPRNRTACAAPIHPDPQPRAPLSHHSEGTRQSVARRTNGGCLRQHR
jgi:hypothetical protein